MLTIERILTKNYVNARGWKAKQKLVVIESDDWGSIRMPSLEAYRYFEKKGIDVNGSYFDKYDSLESSEDLELLFDVLSSVKDKNGQWAVLTPCTVVANPNFDKIESVGRREYHYELISKTYEQYYQSSKVLTLFREGIANRIFYPQFHGREHVNVRRWMDAINSSVEKEKMAFELKAVIGSEMKNSSNNYPLNYFAAFDYDDEVHQNELNMIVREGLNIFEELFGFRSLSFIPCCGICGNELNAELKEQGIKFLQCGQQYLPQGNGTLKRQNRYWGESNDLGQLYWRRNCTFEPSRDQDIDWVDRCLSEINIAFRWGKPAVINAHRVNFIGGIVPENRDKTLMKLRCLLRKILRKWPDVQFIDSEQLAKIIDNRSDSLVNA